MKAFVMKSVGQVGFMEKPIPEPGSNDAIVQTTRALMCTSDSHTVRGAIGPRENLTLGHEAVGVIHAVGGNVRRFKPGDRALVGAITPDWGDPYAQAGHPSQSGGALGGWKFSNVKDGVFAEYFHVNEADANIGYHGAGEFVHLPRAEWGVGMAEKTITTGLCPGGRLRMERLLRLLEMKRVDPTLMTTHTFSFHELDKAFEIMDQKLEGVLKPLIVF